MPLIRPILRPSLKAQHRGVTGVQFLPYPKKIRGSAILKIPQPRREPPKQR